MNVCMNVLYVSGGYLLKSVALCKLLFFQVVRSSKWNVSWFVRNTFSKNKLIAIIQHNYLNYDGIGKRKGGKECTKTKKIPPNQQISCNTAAGVKLPSFLPGRRYLNPSNFVSPSREYDIYIHTDRQTGIRCKSIDFGRFLLRHSLQISGNIMCRVGAMIPLEVFIDVRHGIRIGPRICRSQYLDSVG